MVAAVLFDLDNTLIDRDAALHALVRSAFPYLRPAQEELIRLDQNGYGDRSGFFSRWRELGGQDMSIDQFGKELAKFIEPDEALLSALSKLSSTFKLGIITNGGIVSQTAKWQAAGLDRVIPKEWVWISAALGLRKPEPAIFRHACRALNVLPSQALYIGDRPEIDILGAERAGMNAELAETPLSAVSISRLWNFAGLENAL